MEVRANLAVYKGHMLPGQQHTVPAGLGLARLPASHASPFPACTALTVSPPSIPLPLALPFCSMGRGHLPLLQPLLLCQLWS